MEHPVAVVSGALRGIGCAIAKALSDTHLVYAGARTREALTDLLESHPNIGTR